MESSFIYLFVFWYIYLFFGIFIYLFACFRFRIQFCQERKGFLIIVMRSAKPMESSRNNTMAQKQPSPGSDVREAGALAGGSCESAAAAAVFKM